MNCRLKRAIVAKTVKLLLVTLLKCIVCLWAHPSIAARLNYLKMCTEQAGKAKPGIIIYYQYYGQSFRSYSRSSVYCARTAECRTALCIRELQTHLLNTQVLQRDGVGEEVAQKQKAMQDLSNLDTALGSEDLINRPFSFGALQAKVVNNKVKPPIFSPGYRTVRSPPSPSGDREDLLPCQWCWNAAQGAEHC